MVGPQRSGGSRWTRVSAGVRAARPGEVVRAQGSDHVAGDSPPLAHMRVRRKVATKRIQLSPVAGRATPVRVTVSAVTRGSAGAVPGVRPRDVAGLAGHGSCRGDRVARSGRSAVARWAGRGCRGVKFPCGWRGRVRAGSVPLVAAWAGPLGWVLGYPGVGSVYNDAACLV